MNPLKLKILVVDDDPFVREMLSDILESSDYAVEKAQDGADALDRYQRIPDIGLIISDMNMPGMSGIELIRELRTLGSKIPIIILTANNEVNIAVEAINAGASDYQFKDENIQDTILISVRKCLEKDFIEKQNLDLMKKLQDTLAHMNAILDNMADGLLVTDNEGRIVRANPSFLSMFELHEVNISDKHSSVTNNKDLNDLIGKNANCPDEVFMSEVLLSGGRTGKAVATPIHKDLLDGSEHERIGSVIIVRDITSEKEVDRMKTDFISTVSHELRTPLTSVIGFAKLIKKKFVDVLVPQITSDDRKVQKAVTQISDNLTVIVSEGERLTALINDVLDIAKMEAGKVEWKKDPFSVAELIDRATAATTSLFEQKGLTVIKDIEDGIPYLVGDRDRLIQVVINLLSNAVKFTDCGSVTCRAKREDKEIIVSVTDSGIGIACDDLPKVFEKFKQVGDTLTNKPEGTGLGLPICREIVEHHGGRIWAESCMGKGSTFAFALPLTLAVKDDTGSEL
jgi:PAS domain S-box-containing protein